MWKCDFENKKCFSLIQRDFLYVVIILVIMGIGILTKVFSSDQKAIDLFSFASTITSIILSVLAIFMTLISEYKNENTKAKIDNATNKIEESTDQLLSVQEDLNKNLPDYQQVVSRLDGILERLQKLETHTEHIERAVIKSENEDLKNTHKKLIKPIIDTRVKK